jgi:hypothetical protein
MQISYLDMQLFPLKFAHYIGTCFWPFWLYFSVLAILLLEIPAVDPWSTCVWNLDWGAGDVLFLSTSDAQIAPGVSWVSVPIHTNHLQRGVLQQKDTVCCWETAAVAKYQLHCEQLLSQERWNSWPPSRPCTSEFSREPPSWLFAQVSNLPGSQFTAGKADYSLTPAWLAGWLSVSRVRTLPLVLSV